MPWGEPQPGAELLTLGQSCGLVEQPLCTVLPWFLCSQGLILSHLQELG